MIVNPCLTASLAVITACALSSCTPTPHIELANGESLWVGQWKSSKFLMVSGRIAAAVPDNQPTGESFPIRAKIRYAPHSLYRRSDTVDAKFDAIWGRQSNISGSNQDSPITAKVGAGFSLKLKGGVTNSQQTISYTGNSSTKLTTIRGSYFSSRPFDRGSFLLRKARK